MKVYIVGGPGSGKTTYAKKLSEKYKIPHVELDEMYWINEGNRHYQIKRNGNERAKMLESAISENVEWICDGAYYDGWVDPVFDKADKVIVLQPPRWVRQYRCVKRFVKRKLKIEKSDNKENIVSFCKLLRWSHGYEKKCLPELLDKLKKDNIDCEIIDNR